MILYRQLGGSANVKIVVTANGTHLDAPASPVFGRCPTYLFVDTETMAFEAAENPAMSAPSGAGIQAAQFVVEGGAQAVLTGSVGPNAASVLQTANVPVYQVLEGTVRQAVEMFRQGQLNSISGANVPPNTGMGGGRGMGMGRGMGRGMRRGMGRGMGWGDYGQGIPAAPPPVPPLPESPTSREEEIAALHRTADDLRRQLQEVIERLEKLEKD
jgi:predicted Fe-Mo cluster-binding NifX family protein